MRKFLTLMKTLTAFRNLRLRNTHQPTTLSVAYCNPAGECCAGFSNTNTITITNTTDTLHNTTNDPDLPGSFFLQDDGEDHSKLLTLITSEIEHIRNKQRNENHKKQPVVPLYESIPFIPPPALIVNIHSLQPGTVHAKNIQHLFFHFLTRLISDMKKHLTRKLFISVAILIAASCIANKVHAQNDVIYFDFGNSTFSGSCGGDPDYTFGTSGDNTIAGTSIPSGATLGSIGFEANFESADFFGRSSTVTFFLNAVDAAHEIGSWTVGTSCNTESASSIDPSIFNVDGPNTIYFSASRSSRIYNATLTINYSVCTAPPAPDVPDGGVDFCLNATSVALTATGENLLWYTAPDDPTGSPTAPLPSTNNEGTTAYYVTQTVGCESDKAEIDVTVNPLPVSSVAGFTNISCFGANDGSITVQGYDGSGSYEYSIDDGATWTATFSSDPYQFMGLGAQEYKIRVKDSNQCISKPVQ